MAATDPSVPEVWRAFLRLGISAFGGPAAHTSAMDDEFVRVRGWLSRAEFVDLLSASQVIPGPSSTELAMLIGHRRASWGGLMAAGLAFILPSTLLVWALAWTYTQFGARVEVSAVLRGVRPVVCAVLAVALWRLVQIQPRTMRVGVVAAGAFALRLAGVHELLVLVLAALVMLGARASARLPERALVAITALGLVFSSTLGPISVPWWGGGVAESTSGAALGAAQAGVATIFETFARIGSTVFGSGYVLVAYLRSAFVEGSPWLTEAQLLDAVAVGQVTPGPVFSTATFIGYLLHGTSGAVAATVGIFLPAFCFAALSGILVPRLRASPRAAAALDGLNVASLSIFCAVLVAMVRDVLSDPFSLMAGAVAFAALLAGRVSTLWVLLGGAGLGLLSAYASPFALAALRSATLG